MQRNVCLGDSQAETLCASHYWYKDKTNSPCAKGLYRHTMDCTATLHIKESIAHVKCGHILRTIISVEIQAGCSIILCPHTT